MAGSRPKQELPNIESLQGEKNYLQWSALMKDHLAACDMWDIVEGTELAPAEPDALAQDATEAQKRQFKEKKAQEKDYRLRAASAKNCINQMVEAVHRQIIIGPDVNTAKQAWDKLADQFWKNTAVNRIQIMQKLFKLEQGDLSVDDYFAEYNNLVGPLAKLNFDLPADAGPAILLNGLSKKFETLGLVYGAKENLSVAMLQEALGQYEKQIKETSNGNETTFSSEKMGMIFSRKQLKPVHASTVGRLVTIDIIVQNLRSTVCSVAEELVPGSRGRGRWFNRGVHPQFNRNQTLDGALNGPGYQNGGTQDPYPGPPRGFLARPGRRSPRAYRQTWHPLLIGSKSWGYLGKFRNSKRKRQRQRF